MSIYLMKESKKRSLYTSYICTIYTNAHAHVCKGTACMHAHVYAHTQTHVHTCMSIKINIHHPQHSRTRPITSIDLEVQT